MWTHPVTAECFCSYVDLLVEGRYTLCDHFGSYQLRNKLLTKIRIGISCHHHQHHQRHRHLHHLHHQTCCCVCSYWCLHDSVDKYPFDVASCICRSYSLVSLIYLFPCYNQLHVSPAGCTGFFKQNGDQSGTRSSQAHTSTNHTWNKCIIVFMFVWQSQTCCRTTSIVQNGNL